MGVSLEIIKQDLISSKPTFEQMNLNKVSFAQEMEYAIQAFSTNPTLLNCDHNSLKNCLVNVALSGLTLSPVMKMAYLVPRKGKCYLDPSYMGLIKIITDTGSVQSIKAKTVYENDPFDIELGSNGFVRHGICKDGKRGKRIGAYSIAVLNDGSMHIEWMYEAELMAIKSRSKTTSTSTPWTTDEDEMCRKTVVKRHWKYLPKSERAMLASQAIAFDDEVNGIDFDKEKQAANPSNPAATPDAPFENALATDEDFVKIFNLLHDEAIIGVQNEEGIYESGLEFFHHMPKIKPSSIEKAMIKHQDANPRTLEKSKAEEYIAWLTDEIRIAKLPKKETQEQTPNE